MAVSTEVFDSTFTIDLEILNVLNAIYDDLSHVISKIPDPASPELLYGISTPVPRNPSTEHNGSEKNSPVVAEARGDSKFKNDIIYLVSLLCIVCHGLSHHSMLRNRAKTGLLGTQGILPGVVEEACLVSRSIMCGFTQLATNSMYVPKKLHADEWSGEGLSS